MNRSHAIAAGVTLVVIGVAVGLLVVPVTERDPRPSAQSFEVGESPSYRIVGNISVDGRVVLGVDGAVNESGASRVRIVETDVVTERYRGQNTDVEYRRLVVDGDRVQRRASRIEQDPDRTLIDVECDAGRAHLVSVANVTTSSGPTGGAAVILTELRLAAYERIEPSKERERRILGPRSGWYEGRQSYRLAGATGTVTLEAESNVVHSADVTWKRTAGTETYLHYLFLRNTTIEKTIRYRYRSGEIEIERPAWVGDVADDEGSPESDGGIDDPVCS